jgi:hypothetical protein
MLTHSLHRHPNLPQTKHEQIPGGELTDSRVLTGVMFNKDVTHSKMRRRIEKPRILLLDCPLEYKKGESQANVEVQQEDVSMPCVCVCVGGWVGVEGGIGVGGWVLGESGKDGVVMDHHTHPPRIHTPRTGITRSC